MAHEKLKIGIMFGGASSEYDVSCTSATAVLNHIDTEKYEIFKIGIMLDGRWFVYTGDNSKIKDLSWVDDTENLIPAIVSPCPAHKGIMFLNKAEKTYQIVGLDCIFPVLHGENGEDGIMQGLLELSGVPFVGSKTRSAAVTMDKASTKLAVQQIKIRQASWLLLYHHEYKEHNHDPLLKFVSKSFKYPVFVKPSNAGSSVGVSKVKDESELEAAIDIASKVDDKILVEQGIKGREIEVAILERFVDGKKKVIASPCGEIRPAGEFYDYNAKYINDQSECIIPAILDEKVSNAIKQAAIRIFKATDCSGLARADFFVDGENVVFNEINAIPGFTKISMFPKLFNEEGIGFTELIDILIDTAIEDDAKNKRQ